MRSEQNNPWATGLTYDILVDITLTSTQDKNRGVSGLEIVQQSPLHPHQDNGYYYGTTLILQLCREKRLFKLRSIHLFLAQLSKCPCKMVLNAVHVNSRSNAEQISFCVQAYQARQ
jgi:hypothetical protein